MSDKDFTTEVLDEVRNMHNLTGVFPHKHGLVVEKILDIIDGAYARYDDPVQVRELQVHQLYSFLKKAYRRGHRDGLHNASERIKSTIFGIEP